MEERLLTVAQVAEQLGVTEETVRVWLRQGRLSGFMFGGRKAGYRIAESEVRRFVEAGRRGKARAA